MAQGSSTLPAFMLLPKPCRTMKAGRRSPGATPSGACTKPASVRPSYVNATRCSDISSGTARRCVRFECLVQLLLEHVPNIVAVGNEGRAALERFVVHPARSGQ